MQTANQQWQELKKQVLALCDTFMEHQEEAQAQEGGKG